MKFNAILLSCSLLAGSLTAAASEPVIPVIDAIDMARSDSQSQNLFISYTLNRPLDLKSAQEVIVTPVLHFANDSIELQPVILAGRTAYLAHKRNDDTPKGADLFRSKGEPIVRTASVPYTEDMTSATLTFRSETRGCHCKSDGVTQLPPTMTVDFAPETFTLIIPVEELRAMNNKPEEVVKTRSISRSAYVNYKVGSMELLPDFKSNPLELAAITATIDSVRSDKDLTVNAVRIHGYASPEGGYKLNAKLAAGRTEALRKYVDKLYGFGSLLTSESTPEDWVGLREWVAASQLSDKNAILAVIDSNLTPDEKDTKIKKQFPATYQLLLEEVYPSLRRADYKIDYTVKSFTEPATISDLLKRDPSKLSFDEMMVLADSYAVGSPQRNSIITRAAELFPDDPRAQLNAAFLALEVNDLAKAEQLLKNSGTTPVASYARGVLALYQGNESAARPLLTTAASAGVTGAQAALQTLK